jgi:predicted ATP-dependent endonuclease of OLD family
MPANVLISELALDKFKKVDAVLIKMASTNVLVGGNNAGKSSVLQGIHFSVDGVKLPVPLQRKLAPIP